MAVFNLPESLRLLFPPRISGIFQGFPGETAALRIYLSSLDLNIVLNQHEAIYCLPVLKVQFAFSHFINSPLTNPTSLKSGSSGRK